MITSQQKLTKLLLKSASLAAVLVAGSAHAVPFLQLNFTGGTYDNGTETVVSSGPTATLNAYLKEGNKTALTDTYYLSIAVSPQLSTASALGSFTIDGAPINVTADMVYGTPPAEAAQDHDANDLPKHSVFPTYFYEYAFTFDANDTTASVDVEPNPGNDPTTNTGTDLYYRSFSIDASLLDPSIGLHFDLYNLTVRSSGDIDVNVNAPFSHDAELTPKEPPVPPQEVPAPGTLLLLAAPLLGFGLRSVCRKRG